MKHYFTFFIDHCLFCIVRLKIELKFFIITFLLFQKNKTTFSLVYLNRKTSLDRRAKALNVIKTKTVSKTRQRQKESAKPKKTDQEKAEKPESSGQE